MKTILISLVWTFGLVLAGRSQTWHDNVNLTVSGDTNSVADAASYLSRELRSLGDITVNDGVPDYTIDVVVFPTKMASGRIIGYSLSVVVTAPMPEFMLDYMSVSNAGNRQYIRSYVDLTMHDSLGGPDLREECSHAITRIDENVFQKQRSLFVRMRQFIATNNPAASSPRPPWEIEKTPPNTNTP